MNRRSVQRFVALIMGFAATGYAAPTTANDNQQPRYLDLPQTTACIDNMVATGRANNALSGLSAVTVLHGKVVYRRGFGTVAPTSTQPVLPTTRFRVGSLTKTMTATAVLSLVDEGAIKMSAPASRLLPGFALPGEPGWSEKLTAHNLLSHQGGLTDFATLAGP